MAAKRTTKTVGTAIGTTGTATGTTKTTGAETQTQTLVIELPPLSIRTVEITIVGDSPLICHRWSAKAKTAMLSKQMRRGVQARPAKDPEQDYMDSLYPLPAGGYGFPTVGLKSAAVDACSHIANVTKVQARGSFHINGEFVRIDGEPTMREDMVRIGMGTADIRYRGEFKKWSATFEVRYNSNVITSEQIMNLFNTSGFAIGIGEWRPSKDGSYGMFHVETLAEREGLDTGSAKENKIPRVQEGMLMDNATGDNPGSGNLGGGNGHGYKTRREAGRV